MKKITKIVTFYDDGTFSESTPSPGYNPPYIPPVPFPAPYNPSAPYGPINPAPWPSYPQYTITCKMEDGSIQEFATNGPIVAQGKS